MVAEIGFAPAAERQVVDVVRTEVVQERRRILARDFDLPRRRAIEDECALKRLLIFPFGVAEMQWHIETGDFGECRAGGSEQFRQWCRTRHWLLAPNVVRSLRDG